MLTDENRRLYVAILKDELRLAMGCTEPIAIAYAAAVAASCLEGAAERISVQASGSILKNAKSVVVPNTGGMRGIEVATAIGILAGNPNMELRVLEAVTQADAAKIPAFLEKISTSVSQIDSDNIFDIAVTLENCGHSAYVRITDDHTNITELRKDGKSLQSAGGARPAEAAVDRSFMNIADIVAFADSVDTAEIADTLEQQIQSNSKIADEGLSGDYGANIGSVLLKYGSPDVVTRAKARAAAASDARMNGCELPVVINSGSGNQGITASIPVIEYARELGSSKEQLYRALAISNLTSIHMKTGIGKLSAYCGAVSAGCGSGAGIAYLHGGGLDEIAHTIVNALAITSGIICDGAKASCAAKIASAVDAGILGYQMYLNGQQFYSGDGIVGKGVEATIANAGRLARDGMAATNQEILRIMLDC
ncbi:L-serine ammonia-lyase, iron-sulfur-dependent, subunit alpha [Ruminococcaceae bacterium OttesenSCG-928-D13]|nr:L-serine ammonia-lyase, iron-sulfur-dependent, subunit alpha [Ruminococcaceae bacterium OttesenSCG-928-D13]